jgi:pyruvate dehydrogenase E2 component (dihydrolipoamide acetyltransferase)
MATPIVMPQIAEGMETGIVVEWLVQEGDSVSKGDIVVNVEGEKGIFEVEAYESGVLLKILHEEDDEVAVLQPIGYIGQPGEELQPDEPEEAVSACSEETPVMAVNGAKDNGQTIPGKIKASPAAKRIAREQGIDLHAVTGSGPQGRIVEADVLQTIAGAQDSDAETGVEKFSKMQQHIADTMTRSKQSIPHFYLFTEVDVTEIVEKLSTLNETESPRISMTAVVVSAVSLGLRGFDRLNAHVSANGLSMKADINIGIAVAVEDGLLVPVIKRADRMDVRKINATIKSHAEAAGQGVVRGAGAGTFTVSNLGMFGITKFLPIINPPECAILGVGAAVSTVKQGNDGFETREIMTLSIACDHRGVDGVYGARFLQAVKEMMEDTKMLYTE